MVNNMTKIKELTYFLNSIKETLPFDDEKDLIEKIRKSKDFRIKVQKLVYISKFFGWNNDYQFNFHRYGPYSCELSNDYRNISEDLSPISSTINLKTDSLKDFIKNQPNEFLEATSTILYYISKVKLENFDKNRILDILSFLKPHIPKTVMVESYKKIREYDLINPDMSPEKRYTLTKEIALDKLDGLISIFENYEVCSNQMLFLGTLDYFRLALKRETLKKQEKNELLKTVFEYGEYIENFYFTQNMLPENFPYYDLTPVNEEFDRLQHHIESLGILPRLNDENVDLSVFLENDELFCMD